MGTRGIMGLVIEGQTKITYNHFDSYPSGLGTDVLNGLRLLLTQGDGERLVELARNLVVVDEDSKPTPEQIEALAKHADTGVSTGSLQEWYVLLRNLQGDFKATVEAGVMTDASHFPLDGLFCEWGYVANIDTGHLEVYRGFQKERPTKGLWAGLPTNEWYAEEIEAVRKSGNDNYADILQAKLDKGDLYYAVNLIASFTFADIASGAVTSDAMDAVEKSVYGDDD